MRGHRGFLLIRLASPIALLAVTIAAAPLAQAAGSISWTPVSSVASFDATAAAYGNGAYVVVGGSTTSVLVSTDGSSFASVSPAVARSWNSIAYAGGRFVAVGDTGGYMSSADGTTWSGGVQGIAAWTGIAYGNSTYAAVSSGFGGWSAMTSADGATWTNRSVGENAWTDLAFGNGVFVALKDGKTATSTDGITWSLNTVAALNNPYSIAFGNGTFVAVSSIGDRAWVSTDGVSWTAATSIDAESWKSVAFGDGTFLAVADGGATATSTDGSAWTSQGSPLGVSYLNSAAVGGGRFLVGGLSGTPRVAFGTLSSSPSGALPSWLRSYARAHETDACEAGWTPSWEEWPHAGSGGWTCTQATVWNGISWITVPGYR